jgi:hypothetical protein
MLFLFKLELVLAQFMWKQQVQVLQFSPFVPPPPPWHGQDLPERLPEIISNAAA